jgi:hypothetical protein
MTTPMSLAPTGSVGVAGRAFASIPTRWPSASASRARRVKSAPMSGDLHRCAAIALPTRFPCAAELWSVGKQENGRGGALTPPDPAPNRPAQWRGYFPEVLALLLPARLPEGQEGDNDGTTQRAG